MNYFLGIDGGGTKTKFILCDRAGYILAESIQPTCHYLQCGLDGVQKVIEDGISKCLNQSRIERTQILHAFMACAGYGDIEGDNPKIMKACEKAFLSIPFSIGNDTENALAGSLGGQAGINIIAGTGSIGMGKTQTGETLRSGGWHHIFGGDEGSAYWLASNLLRLYTRQSDGRDSKTQLYYYLKEKMNWIHDSDLLAQCVVNWNYDRTKVASLAKHLYVLAEMNDPHAIQLYKDAAKELSDIAISIYKKLDMKTNTLVSYTGGVFQSGSYILKPFLAYLKPYSMKLIEPILPPDRGSLLLAMSYANISITDELLENLRL